jgi:hypothetical protein
MFSLYYIYCCTNLHFVTRKHIYLLAIIFGLAFKVLNVNAQNLISNPSFAEILDSSVNSIPYKINLFGKSNVKDWYMLNVKSNREIPIYYTARDVEYYNSTRNYTYSEHMLYKNNGFIKLNVNALF